MDRSLRFRPHYTGKGAMLSGFAPLLLKFTAQLSDSHRKESGGVLWINASFVGGF
jgi:hypothetical protein